MYLFIYVFLFIYLLIYLFIYLFIYLLFDYLYLIIYIYIYIYSYIYILIYIYGFIFIYIYMYIYCIHLYSKYKHANHWISWYNPQGYLKQPSTGYAEDGPSEYSRTLDTAIWASDSGMPKK